MRVTPERLARVPDQHARDLGIADGRPCTTLRARPGQFLDPGGDAPQRRPPARAAPQHRQRHSDNCKRAPARGAAGDVLHHHPDPVALAVKQEEVAVGPVLAEPTCSTSAARTARSACREPQAETEINILEIAEEALRRIRRRRGTHRARRARSRRKARTLRGPVGSESPASRRRRARPCRRWNRRRRIHRRDRDAALELRRAEHGDVRMPQAWRGCNSSSQFARGIGVGIERGDPGRRASGRAEIVGRGEAEIGAGALAGGSGHRAAVKPRPSRRRGIVDDDGLEIAEGLGCQGIDTELQERAGIVIDDNDAHPGRIDPWSSSAPAWSQVAYRLRK